MTSITRHLARLTACTMTSCGQRRPIVLELDPRTPTLVGFRLKGTRSTYYLPIDHCFREAMRNELARRKVEKKRLRALTSPN
jgi:uncharacterized ParB-like nuclease family protein